MDLAAVVTFDPSLGGSVTDDPAEPIGSDRSQRLGALEYLPARLHTVASAVSIWLSENGTTALGARFDNGIFRAGFREMTPSSSAAHHRSEVRVDRSDGRRRQVKQRNRI